MPPTTSTSVDQDSSVIFTLRVRVPACHGGTKCVRLRPQERADRDGDTRSGGRHKIVLRRVRDELGAEIPREATPCWFLFLFVAFFISKCAETPLHAVFCLCVCILTTLLSSSSSSSSAAAAASAACPPQLNSLLSLRGGRRLVGYSSFFFFVGYGCRWCVIVSLYIMNV